MVSISPCRAKELEALCLLVFRVGERSGLNFVVAHLKWRNDIYSFDGSLQIHTQPKWSFILHFGLNTTWLYIPFT